MTNDEHSGRAQLAGLIREYLGRRRITQGTFATAIGASASNVSSWLAGHSAPSCENSCSIARVLGLDPLYVLNLAGYDVAWPPPGKEADTIIPEMRAELQGLSPDEQAAAVPALQLAVRLLRRSIEPAPLRVQSRPTEAESLLAEGQPEYDSPGSSRTRASGTSD